MASISFDKSTGWWSVRYFAGPDKPRAKKPLCKHPGAWSKSRPPKRPPDGVAELAEPFLEIERKARLGIAPPPAPNKTGLRKYVEAYQERVAQSLQPMTVAAVGVACRKFVDWCEARKVTTLQGVTYTVCRDWISHRLKEGAKRSTVLTERSNLAPIWTQAVMERAVTENPWLLARVPGKSRAEIPTAWTQEEVSRLVAKADGWLRDLILLGVNTGIRINAMLSLKWSQIDWAAGLIRVRAANSKSGRPYDVPITNAANDVLMARHLAETRKGDRYLFENPATGKPFTSRTTFTRIGRAARAAKVTDHGDYNHILRRTFATLALNSGVSLEVVSRCLDHATLAQTQRAYCHILAGRLVQGMAGFNVAP